jgi:hypothetical protein
MDHTPIYPSIPPPILPRHQPTDRQLNLDHEHWGTLGRAQSRRGVGARCLWRLMLAVNVISR